MSTAGSAIALGLDDVGTIEPGKRADLAVLDVDPMKDMGALTQRQTIWMVVLGGRVVAGQGVDSGALRGWTN